MANKEAVLYELQDELVRRAEQLVIDLGFKGKEVSEIGKTQASKALEVAQTAGTLAVFANWVRYQAGREKSAEFWTRIVKEQSPPRERPLAQALAAHLGWVQQQIAQRLGDVPKAEQDLVTMRAVVRFLGYFRRALIGAAYLGSIALEGQP